MHKALALLLFSSLSGFLYGQNTKNWTLRECIEYAQKNNLQIKQSALNAELGKVKIEQSYGSMLPTLNGSASQNYNSGRSIDPFTNQFNQNTIQSNSLSLSSTVSLFQGFQLTNSVKQSYLDLRSNLMDLEKLKNDIGLNVATAYLQILYNKELLTVSKVQLEGIKAQTVRTKKLVESGSLPNGSLLEAEAQLALEEQRMITSQNQLEISKLTLLQLLDLRDTSALSIADPNIPLPSQDLLNSNVEDIYLAALSNQPDIKSAEYKTKSADIGINIANGSRSPRLFLSGNIGTIYSNQAREYGFTTFYSTLSGVDAQGNPITFTVPQVGQVPGGVVPRAKQFDNNFSKSVGLTLQIPLINNLQASTGVRRAKINMQNAELNMQVVKNNLYKTIQQSYTDATTALKRYNAAKKTQISQTQAFTYAEQKYGSGLMNFVEYLTARTNQYRAESDLLQAKYDFIFRLKVLDFYSGKPLSF